MSERKFTPPIEKLIEDYANVDPECCPTCARVRAIADKYVPSIRAAQAASPYGALDQSKLTFMLTIDVEVDSTRNGLEMKYAFAMPHLVDEQPSAEKAGVITNVLQSMEESLAQAWALAFSGNEAIALVHAMQDEVSVAVNEEDASRAETPHLN